MKIETLKEEIKNVKKQRRTGYGNIRHKLEGTSEFADSVRKHWSIENQLHWCLDIIYREDASRARKNNSPLNFNVLRKTALALVTQAQYGRISKKKLMFKAALNPDTLLNILFSKK